MHTARTGSSGSGTHSGSGNLRQRLSEHYRKTNKDRSIFLKHLGRCLLAARDDPFLMQWEIDLTTRAARERYTGEIDHDHLQRVEQEVSDYLTRSFTFIALTVVEKSDRRTVEHGLLVHRLSRMVQAWARRRAALRVDGVNHLSVSVH